MKKKNYFDACDLMHAKDWRDFLRKMPLTITVEASVFNHKACEIQGRSPGEGYGVRSPPHQKKKLFFSRLDKFMDEHFFYQKWSNLHERCGMCWNEWKIHFQIFTIFSFWDMVDFDFPAMCIFLCGIPISFFCHCIAKYCVQGT